MVSFGSWAEKAPSIMFDEPTPDYLQKPESDADKLRAECTELSKEMERLKGRPIRRAAAAERHKANCENLYTGDQSRQGLAK